jgi:hypothetical protein
MLIVRGGFLGGVCGGLKERVEYGCDGRSCRFNGFVVVVSRLGI